MSEPHGRDWGLDDRVCSLCVSHASNPLLKEVLPQPAVQLPEKGTWPERLGSVPVIGYASRPRLECNVAIQEVPQVLAAASSWHTLTGRGHQGSGFSSDGIRALSPGQVQRKRGVPGRYELSTDTDLLIHLPSQMRKTSSQDCWGMSHP